MLRIENRLSSSLFDSERHEKKKKLIYRGRQNYRLILIHRAINWYVANRDRPSHSSYLMLMVYNYSLIQGTELFLT